MSFSIFENRKIWNFSILQGLFNFYFMLENFLHRLDLLLKQQILVIYIFPTKDNRIHEEIMEKFFCIFFYQRYWKYFLNFTVLLVLWSQCNTHTKTEMKIFINYSRIPLSECIKDKIGFIILIKRSIVIEDTHYLIIISRNIIFLCIVQAGGKYYCSILYPHSASP